jgi:hypothetical protein
MNGQKGYRENIFLDSLPSSFWDTFDPVLLTLICSSGKTIKNKSATTQMELIDLEQLYYEK